jgi:hypothetical protein
MSCHVEVAETLKEKTPGTSFPINGCPPITKLYGGESETSYTSNTPIKIVFYRTEAFFSKHLDFG